MKTRKLGFSDLNLTTVGLGAWAIGGPWQFGWGPQDDQDSIATINEAIDNGINWIDTAPIYGHGHSEIILGKAIKGLSQKPIIATKCGLVWDEKNERIPRLNPKSVRQECEQSLKRLGVDAIDLYQIHWPSSTEEAVDGWGEIARLIKDGKVRFGGVSNFSVEQIEKCQQVHPVASLQPQYNMLFRNIEKDQMPFCKKNNIGIVAYSPMARGLLTGKFSREHLNTLAPDDHRRKSDIFIEPAFSKNLEFVERIKPIAQRNGKTSAQLAIAWVLRRDEITSAIVGARKPGQIGETAKAGDWSLSRQDIAEIENIINEMQI
jgi:aryl-alcohol dehydrogenase-like predicted oxidoreductase